MLYLLLSADKDRYALPAAEIIEVVPLVQLKNFRYGIPEIAGVFNYHGVMTPVIDLSVILTDRPSKILLSSRIVLRKFIPEPGTSRTLGLLGERIVGTFRCSERDLHLPGVNLQQVPFLGRIIPDEEGMIQEILPDRLISDSIREALINHSEFQT